MSKLEVAAVAMATAGMWGRVMMDDGLGRDRWEKGGGREQSRKGKRKSSRQRLTLSISSDYNLSCAVCSVNKMFC